MREKLNENPLAQIVVIGVLALVVGVFVLHGLGGGGESEAAEAPATVESGPTSEAASGEVGTVGSEPTAATTSVELPHGGRMPADVEAAYQRGETIVLLVYRSGGIDDKLTRESAAVASTISDVAFSEVDVRHVGRYAEITGPLGVEQAPALIVISPKGMNGGGPAPATVAYGFQTADDVRQAIVDSRYEGPELTYAPK